MENWSVRRREAAEWARRSYGEVYAGLRFLDQASAEAAEVERAALLADIGQRAQVGAHGTKLDCRNLSPGCRACMAGSWSCLFINSRCNAACFYCPSAQEEAAVPVTNTIPFDRSDEYAAYVDRLGFTGVGISGGEPLLNLDRSVEYLDAVKRRLGDRVHTWLYTNGLLLTEQGARRLRGSGLDELRVDISAVGYSLEAVSLAARVFPTVTVEIPAIPEDEGLLQGLLPRLVDAGVAHLNLHQLKATPYNLKAFADRGYTFQHEEQLTVLGSELSALRLLRRALDQGTPLPINYCSLAYKMRFQKVAARQRGAALIRRSYEDICQSGLLRQASVFGAAAPMAALASRLRLSDAPAEAWALLPGGEALCFSGNIWSHMAPLSTPLRLTYQLPRVLSSVTYHNAFLEIPLMGQRRIAVERVHQGEVHDLGTEDAAHFGRLFLEPREAGDLGPDPAISVASRPLTRVLHLEQLKRGLEAYL